MRPQHDGERARDLLAEPRSGHEEEVIDGVHAHGIARDVQVVRRVAMDPRLHGLHPVVLVGQAGGDAARQVADARRQVRGKLQVLAVHGRHVLRVRQAQRARVRHGNLRDDRVDESAIQEDGRADRSEMVGLQPARREVDLFGHRGREQHVGLRGVDVERLDDADRRNRPDRRRRDCSAGRPRSGRRPIA